MRRLALLFLVACTENPEPEPLVCTSDLARFEAVDPAQVSIEWSGGENVRFAVDDLRRYLERMWGAPISTSPTPIVIRLSIADMPEGFTLKRQDDILAVTGSNESNLAYGTYELLEELGVRFFHPLEEHVPSYGTAYFPRELDRTMTPAFRVRGIHLHTLHPIEWFDAFNGSNLDEAKRFIDWLVKTGQNHVQWPILRTMDLESWSLHARAIIEYAHLRGVTVGVEPLLFSASALQNNFVLASQDPWEAELDQNVDFLTNIGFDQIELAMGEFLSEDPEQVISMLDRVVERSGIDVSVVNHIGNFPNLWVDYRGERVFFYFLPAHADARLIQNVHTVYFYDLYRPRGAYGHDDFFMHREFLFEQLAAGRTVRYKPESAYWVSHDVDVPLFLPEYVHSRWNDIHRLVEEVRSRSLPPLDGHVTFSSGHEWGYWMTDYLTAKMMWSPEKDLDHFFAHYAASFGTCSTQAQAALTRFTELQTQYLFDQRLISYLSGDDFHDDLGAIAGFVTIPARLPFEKALALAGEERAAFRAEVIDPLATFAEEARSIESEVAKICAAFASPWCAELLDGVAIVRLRAQHASHLYAAVDLSRRSPEEAQAELARAAEILTEAEAVIARREPYYRFDAARLTGAKDNPTIYRYGYLRQAHLTCYWKRQALQAEHVVVHQAPALVSDLPQCLE
jgi:hypothetical protein